MQFSIENLLKQLDQPEVIHWALELKHGPEAYAFINRALTNRELNANQTVNALHALFRIRQHGNSSEVLQVFIAQAGHTDERIRSEAIKLAVGLVQFTRSREKIPIELSDSQKQVLLGALEGGKLTPIAANLLRRFLDGEKLQEPSIPRNILFFRCDNGHIFSGEVCPWDGWSHPELGKVLNLVERFKSEQVVVSIQGLKDTGADEAILKRVLLTEFGDAEVPFEALCPKQIMVHGEIKTS